MAAPKGNEYYKLRSKDGRDRIFNTPEDLLNACNEYFEWCQNNPLLESTLQKRKVSRDEEIIETYTIPKLRPFTIQGLCNFLDIAISTFQEYEKREGFSVITTRARQIIYNQKFEGAASGFLNPSIIARDLGLTDKSETRVIQEQPLFGDEES